MRTKILAFATFFACGSWVSQAKDVYIQGEEAMTLLGQAKPSGRLQYVNHGHDEGAPTPADGLPTWIYEVYQIDEKTECYKLKETRPLTLLKTTDNDSQPKVYCKKEVFEGQPVPVPKSVRKHFVGEEAEKLLGHTPASGRTQTVNGGAAWLGGKPKGLRDGAAPTITYDIYYVSAQLTCFKARGVIDAAEFKDRGLSVPDPVYCEEPQFVDEAPRSRQHY